MAAVTSCSDDSRLSVPGVGTLALSLELQPAIPQADGAGPDVVNPYSITSAEVAITMSSASGVYSHTWTDFSQFPQAEEYFAGTYKLDITAGNVEEGYDSAYFGNTAEVSVSEGQRTDASVTLPLLSVLFRAEMEVESPSGIRLESLDLQSETGVVQPLRPDAPDGSYLSMNGTEKWMYATLSRPAGDTVRVQLMNFQPRTGLLYTVTSRFDDNTLTVTCGGNESVTVLDDAFFARRCAVIADSWSAPLTVPEGETPSGSVVATVTPGSAPLEHLYLTTLSASLIFGDVMPKHVDLLHLTSSQQAVIDKSGLKINRVGESIEVDYTDLIGSLVYLSPLYSRSVFSLQALSADGTASEPSVLTVDTTPIEIDVTGFDPAVMGVDSAAIFVACPSPGFASHVGIEVEDSETGLYASAPHSSRALDPGRWEVRFPVPAGSQPVSVRVLYCDEVRKVVSIPRHQPEFTIEVDPYASSAGIRIVPADTALLPTITDGVSIYIDGKETPVYQRFPRDGYLSVIGLRPSTSYVFRATMMSGADGPVFTPQVTVRTEQAAQLPNSDFEERKDGVIYDNLPSGGRYSQTTVELFNWQHHTSYDQEVPDGWANTNAKTFARSSTNHNTWYMQPSVALDRSVSFSKSFSVRLTSVAFDPDGEPIPDYAQTSQPYLDYSPIVPHIAYRAAGKLFLGSYSYDASSLSEAYREGMSWSSRPLSLNGNYRFIPPANDRSETALVRIQIMGHVNGKETVIAESEKSLPLATDFTAFSVPLGYSYFGVKATGIRVMFSSSSHIGTIAEETAAIHTVADPVTATRTGGTLWVDNITLAY